MLKLLAFISLCFAVATSQQGNIVQELQKLGTTELIKLAAQAGLASALETGGPFTVFAPTDEAFKNLPPRLVHEITNNKTRLTEVLSFHVLKGIVKSTDLKNDLVAPSLFADHSVRVNIYTNEQGNVITVDGSPVISADNMASNGVIHEIGRVLFPIPEGTVTDFVAKEPPFSTLLTAVQKAGLASTLAADGPYTVFAPTNAAFQRLPPGTLDKLLANVTALTNVLTYHVVKGTYYSEGLKREQDVPTVQGKDVHIMKQGPGHVEVDQARVEIPNVPVTNGVIHAIDGVLIPPEEMYYLFSN